MICACLLAWYVGCVPVINRFVETHVVADDPYERTQLGPWGRRPENPDEWNIDWENWE